MTNFGSAEQVRARPKSGFYGVRADGKRWVALIRFGGKQQRLGIYDTKQEAALAYDWASRKHKGDKALCNYDTIEQAELAAATAAPGCTLSRLKILQPKTRPKSGFYGVSVNGKRWKARLRYGGKEHNLGTYNTKDEAALAYDRAARQHKGTKAVCNFEPPEGSEVPIDGEAPLDADADAPAPALIPTSGRAQKDEEALLVLAGAAPLANGNERTYDL
jgi:hypothetical protein